MEVAHFADLQDEFMACVQAAVYCAMATVDRQQRLRLRVMHPFWNGAMGWVLSWRDRPDQGIASASLGGRHYSLEHMLVAQYQPCLVHHQIRFKPAGQAKVDVAQTPWPLPLVPLARSRHRQRSTVDVGGVERHARSRTFWSSCGWERCCRRA